MTQDYLAGLPAAQQRDLGHVNAAGLAALRGYLASGQAVAFLGAGVSAPLYPLWEGLIGELVEAAADQMGKQEVATLRALASQSPEEVVEIVRQTLGTDGYREVLRAVLRVRTDPVSGRSWTPVQELVCRCAFKAVVTTNYDPGIVDARLRIRPGAAATGFTTWQDEQDLDRWRTGDVFGEAELPVLFAHGQYNRPDSIVLATTEYRRAYAGKLPQVLARLVDGHLAWIGFSFADQRIAAILREIADRTGTRADPGGPPRHVALMAWDPAGKNNDPGILAHRAKIGYGAQAVLYPAPRSDHSALRVLLSTLTDARLAPAADLATRTAQPVTASSAKTGAGAPGVRLTWVHGAERTAFFTGRAEELARLDRWAADPQVALVGVTAWGGAGKTALVTHWLLEAGGVARRPGVRGMFGWSFYADPSAERWAQALLDWAQQQLGVRVTGGAQPTAAVLALLRGVPLLLVLDGLELLQQGRAGAGFGRLLDGTLQEVLAGACQQGHRGLVVLTSRFPFADLEAFDGSSARMLDVPPFTPAEGSALLAAAGGAWLDGTERRAMVQAVDGHALAIGVLAGLLAARPPASDLAALRRGLAAAVRTDARVGRMLTFYADRLSEPDRYLLAAVSLFARPVQAEAVLAVTEHRAFRRRLAGWTPTRVQAAVRDRLGGLATWHPDGTISAHPLVRDTFRPLVLDAAPVAVQTALADIPGGRVTSRAAALRVVEAVELLLDAGQWRPAHDLHTARSEGGSVWKNLPAARLGQRAATAFVGTPARRSACATKLGAAKLTGYLDLVGLYALTAGDLDTARQFLPMVVSRLRDADDTAGLAAGLQNLADCLGAIGEIEPARAAAAESLSLAQQDGNWWKAKYMQACLGWLAGLSGDTAEAGKRFTEADQLVFADDRDGDHLYSRDGTRWAEWLARTGRSRVAWALTSRNREICLRSEYHEDVARCDQLLGRLAIAAGDMATAGQHLAAATRCFRDSDYLTELATTLTDLADYAWAAGDPAAADRHATEAITIAAPRGLVPAQSAALAARARIRAGQATTARSPDLLVQGRDAADAALRLATRHQLAWHELDALRAHAALDQAAGADNGWTAKVTARYARLVPDGLDPNPLGTVERLVARKRGW